MPQKVSNIEVVKKYTSEEAQGGRQHMLEMKLGPVVKIVFDRYPKLQSAVLFTGQFWSGEAYDAIPMEIPFSTKINPDHEAWVKRRDKAFANDFFIESTQGAMAAKVAFTAEGYPEYRTLFQEAWDPNEDAIPLFAGFCKADGNKKKSRAHNFSPYAIFRRASDGADIEIEIIGTMTRPWLDGVMPLSEQVETERPEAAIYAESLNANLSGPGRLEKAVWSKVEDASGGVILGVQNSLDKWMVDELEEEENPLTEFDALKAVLALLLLVFLIMSLMTFAGVPLSIE